MPSIPMVGCSVAWVQFNGSPEFLPGRVQIPIKGVQAKCKRVVGLAERAVQFQRLDRRGLRSWECLLGGHRPIVPIAQQSISVGQARISLGVFRILVDRLIEMSQGDLQSIRRSLVPGVATLEIGLVCSRVDDPYVL